MPDDLVQHVKDFHGETETKRLEEEGKKEPEMIDMDKMFEEMAKNMP